MYAIRSYYGGGPFGPPVSLLRLARVLGLDDLDPELGHIFRRFEEDHHEGRARPGLQVGVVVQHAHLVGQGGLDLGAREHLELEIGEYVAAELLARPEGLAGRVEERGVDLDEFFGLLELVDRLALDDEELTGLLVIDVILTSYNFV